MGAWGTGPFENDDALDWLGTLENCASPADAAAVIQEALRPAIWVWSPPTPRELLPARLCSFSWIESPRGFSNGLLNWRGALQPA